MVEKLHNSHEHSPQQPELTSQQHEALKEINEKAKNARHEHAENIEHIRAKAEIEATSSEDTFEQTTSKNEKDRPTFMNRELKTMAYQRTMKRIRRQLPAPARVLSSILHQPVIESTSEFASKTLARPSGILAGGIFAFIGSSVFLWASRHYGYEYNFLLFALLFVGGFFVGLIVEMLLRVLGKNRS